MAGPKGAAAVEDVSDMDISDSAWDDTNDLMRSDGDPSPEPLDKDIVEDDQDDQVEAQADEGDEPEAQAEDEIDEDEIEEQAEDFLEALVPPNNWPPQEKQFFSQLPPAMQHAYMDRARSLMADYTRKTQEIGQVRQRYADIDRLIGPREKEWAIGGMSTGQALNQLLALSDFAAEKPADFVKFFCEQRGIDLGQLTGSARTGQQGEPATTDPQILQLRRQLSEVQQNLNQSQQTEKKRQETLQRQQYEQQLQQTVQVINQFASQTDSRGRLLYPYFNDLEDDIRIEMQTGRAKNLGEAYQTAVWANPSTRAKMLARSRASENSKARARAEAAKRASSSVSQSNGSGGGRVATGDMSIGDMLRASLRGEIS